MTSSVTNDEQLKPTKQRVADYLWTTESGSVQIILPEVLTPDECKEVEYLFELVIRRMRRNAIPVMPEVPRAPT